MTQTDVAFRPAAHRASREARSRLQERVRAALHAKLARLEASRVAWHEDGAALAFGRPDASRAARIDVHAPRFYSRLVREGSLGAARAYIDGDWSSPDLAALLRVVVAEPALFGGLDGPLARAASAGRALLAPLARNTRRGSRRNIAAHYDLGDALFERMLDPTMTYSSAVFPAPDA
ncbi:MAG: class I SAM-dependent methyltransferase, partial [Myxococcales bacterium]|nr:class I SAM-dependent methyltransferase [Myxococcales bacterium]